VASTHHARFRGGPARPPEEDVAGRLDQALALDHPFAGRVVRARRQVGFEHRSPGLFDLQEQGIISGPNR